MVGGSSVQSPCRASRNPGGLERKVGGMEGASVDLEGDGLVGAEGEGVDEAELDRGRDARLFEALAYIKSLSISRSSLSSQTFIHGSSLGLVLYNFRNP